MTPIEIPHEIDRFVLYFDTPERRVNAYALASSLIGLADAIREANTVVNPGYSVEVVVEALPDGSFQAVVRTVFSKVKNLFSNEAVKAIVYGIIATYIYDGMFKNDTPPQVTVDQHSVVITHGKDRIIVPRDVYEAKRLLEKSARFESAIGQVFHGAATDTTVQGIGLKPRPDHDRPPIYVPREQFACFDSRSGELEDGREIVEIANLEISRAILERGNRRWEFYWRGIKIAAPVLGKV